ncbi:MAG: hypothetical protein LBR60_02450 [Fibrobacter sp.]|jgi:hypothetical protein|nr:hypothetical protein [Fibrobacter sp.]
MELCANRTWAVNRIQILPEVRAEFSVSPHFLSVSFWVKEPLACFRSEVTRHGDRSYEDSCVELFLSFPEFSSVYTNFEWTSRGFCLAARGESREARVPFSEEEYGLLKISSEIHPGAESVSWNLSAEIPRELLLSESPDLTRERITGNLYKCADKAASPHYLSYFPVDTARPDFHRPEFFRVLYEPR